MTCIKNDTDKSPSGHLSVREIRTRDTSPFVNSHTRTPLRSWNSHTRTPLRSWNSHTRTPLRSWNSHTWTPLRSWNSHTRTPLRSWNSHTRTLLRSQRCSTGHLSIHVPAHPNIRTNLRPLHILYRQAPFVKPTRIIVRFNHVKMLHNVINYFKVYQRSIDAYSLM